jgi:hypothetical protein
VLIVPRAVDAAPSTTHLKFGATTVLHGSTARIRTRAYRKIDPLPPEDFNSPKDGYRFVAINLSLKNVGTRAARDSPGNGAKLITRAGKTISTTIYTGDGCTGIYNVSIPRGQTRRGCLVFEVPVGVGVRFFELTWDSGFADETAQWRL